MSINRVTIAGFTDKEAWSRTAPNGNSVTRLSVATTKHYKDAQGTWHEKTQWHTCVAYGLTAERAVKIQTGTHVFLEGELIYREYNRTIETESGPVKVPWPVAEILMDSLSVLDRSQKQERKGAEQTAEPTNADIRSRAYVLRRLQLRRPD